MSIEEKKGKVLSIVTEIVAGKVPQQTTGKIQEVQALSINKVPPTAPVEGRLDITMAFRQIVKKAIETSGKDKYQIIAEMGFLMCRGSLDYSGPEKWASFDIENGLPAEYLPAFCSVTGSLEPLQYIVQQLGYRLADK